MSVRAKFMVESVTHNRVGAVITAYPVTSGSPENAEFFKQTPGGKIELSTVNPEAAEQFVPGKTFYVDFTPCE